MTASGTGVQPKNVVYATLSAGSAVFLLGVIVLVQRVLGTEVFGAFQIALSLATIGEALMDFGIHQVTIRSIARNRQSARQIFQNSLALKVLPGGLMFVVLGIVAFACWSERDLRVACLLMLLGAVVRSYLMTIRGVLLGLERFSDESLVVIGDRVITLAAVAASLWYGAGLVGVCVAFLLARLVAVGGGFILTHRQVGPPKPAFERDIWRDLQLNALPFGAFVVALNVYNYVDTIFLGMMRGTVETGLYGQAYRIYEGLTYAPAILASVLIPRLSHLWSVDRTAHARVLRRSLAGTVLLAVVLGGAVWVLAPFLLTEVFGADGVESVSALRILASGLVFIYAIWILHAAAISVFGQQLMLRTTVIGVIANTAMNLWWIPRYGRDGAAWATVGGEGLTLVLLAVGLRHIWTKNAGRGVAPAGVRDL